MKSLYQTFFSIVLCSSILFGGAAHIQAQPLTLQKVLTGLRSTSSGMSLGQKIDYISLRITQLGVNFTLNSQIEKQLRDAGASNQLIETVRAQSVKETTTKQTNSERIYSAQLNQAHDELENGQRDLAIANFTKAISAKPDDARNYFYRGMAFYLKVDFVRAAADFKKATELDARFKAAFNNLGLAYQKTRQYQEAIEALNRAVELQNNNSYFYNNRGQIFSEIGNYRAALDDYDKSIAIAPNAVTLGNRAFIYYRQNKLDLALSGFDEALRMDSKYVEAYLGRGNVYFDRREYKFAVADFSQAIILQPKDARLYNNRAAVYAEMREYELAAADLRKALQLDPNSPSIRRNLDAVLRKLEN